MKKKFVISYKVVGGGGSQQIELDIPEGAFDMRIEPVKEAKVQVITLDKEGENK